MLKEKLVNIFSGNEMSDYDKRVIMGFGIPTRKSESDCADSRQWEIDQ